MYCLWYRLSRNTILWLLFMVQFILIGMFILFGNTVYNSQTTDHSDKEYTVLFVNNNELHTEMFKKHAKINPTGYSSNFSTDFFKLSHGRVCFLEGSLEKESYDLLQCVCKPEYHGRQCELPEILWRAFMTSKVPLHTIIDLSAIVAKKSHRIFYMILATRISVETLEIQLMELQAIVDVFILCDQSDDSLSKWIETSTGNSVFQRLHNKLFVSEQFSNKKCTPRSLYKNFKQHMLPPYRINGNDILIISRQDEILNRRAILYFKWYDNWPQPVKFRLKYNVYGFYWQHPENTIVSSAICQINYLEENFKGDPERLLRTKKSALIVGDLNHFGGWYCRYCYQPFTIVQQLLFEESKLFDNHIKSIDSTAIERLISNGLYVDSKLGLSRLHRYSESYYAPDSVTNASQKFTNILTNMYASYDDYDTMK